MSGFELLIGLGSAAFAGYNAYMQAQVQRQAGYAQAAMQARAAADQEAATSTQGVRDQEAAKHKMAEAYARAGTQGTGLAGTAPVFAGFETRMRDEQLSKQWSGMEQANAHIAQENYDRWGADQVSPWRAAFASSLPLLGHTIHAENSTGQSDQYDQFGDNDYYYAS
jgi:hypothetical protein